MRWLLLAVAFLGPVQALDDAARSAVQSLRSPALDRGMRAVSDIGKPAVVLGALLGIALFDAHGGVATARLALAALVPTNLAVEGLKRATFRARPDGEHRRSNAAFPSSHAANAFAVALVFARRWRRLAPAFLAFAALVALSRVWLDRHWTSDVLAGAAIGLLGAWAAARWVSGRAARRPAGPAPGAPPGSPVEAPPREW